MVHHREYFYIGATPRGRAWLRFLEKELLFIAPPCPSVVCGGSFSFATTSSSSRVLLRLRHRIFLVFQPLMHAPLEVGRDRDAPAMQALLREKVALCRQRLEHGSDAGMQPRRHVLGVTVQQLQGLPTTELRVGLPRFPIHHRVPLYHTAQFFSPETCWRRCTKSARKCQARAFW